MSDQHGNKIDVHLHFDPITINLQGGGQGSGVTIEQIAALINALKETIMATLADLQTAVANEDTVIDSAITLLQGLAAAVAALKPNQAAIDALAADITAKTQALSDAVVANTPAQP